MHRNSEYFVDTLRERFLHVSSSLFRHKFTEKPTTELTQCSHEVQIE